MFIKNREELDVARKNAKIAMENEKFRILICAGTGCLAGGSEKIYNKMCELVRTNKDVQVLFGDGIAHDENGHCPGEGVCGGIKKSGCHGFCEMGPLVRIEPYNYLYIKVKEEDCEEIYNTTILGGKPVDRLLYEMNGVKYKAQEDIPFYAKQTRLVLKNCGHIDAEHITEYLAVGGYKALEKALFEMKPEEVVDEILESNLRGRGGGGFQAGYKWKQVARQKETQRYVVCNGDEGDPGAFMDRSVMEGDPHKMIEGMIIAAYAVSAHEGYIYVRAEYPLAIKRLKIAIAQAEEAGLLGDNILNSGFSFRLHINRGAGAFVCGEGSALTASIEGERGMPRTKPPRTVEQGLFGKPTVLNNVETYANVPMIIENGANWYKTIGTEGSPGTKAFAVTGSINNTGLIEVPMGTTLREIVYDIGGGIKNNKKFKAVQIGGPSGGCLIGTHLDLPLDFDSLKKMGAMIVGVTGGVTEAVLRHLAKEKNYQTISQISFSGVRGSDGLKETTVKLGERDVKIGIVNGLANAARLLDRIKAGEVHYDFVEVMACRRGCIMGGGQPLPMGARTRKCRTEGIYSVDRESQIRFTDDNPIIEQTYKNYIEGNEHRLLHRAGI